MYTQNQYNKFYNINNIADSELLQTYGVKRKDDGKGINYCKLQREALLGYVMDSIKI